MEREIKFRGYSTEQKRWVYGYYAKIEEKASIDHYIFSVEGKIKVDPTSVGQFTGLLDDIGEYIYEGDLFDYYTLTDWIRAILWCDTCRSFELFSYVGYIDGKAYCEQCSGDIVAGATDVPHDYEIIGNIYENPDWEKKEQNNDGL